MRLQQAYEQWAEAKRPHVAAATWRDYELIWRKYLSPYGNVRLKKVNVKDILNNVADGRRSRVRTVLKMILAEHGIAPVFPTTQRSSVKPRKIHNVPTQADVETLADVVGPIVLLAAGSGLRFGELVALTREDVNGDTITVNKAFCNYSQQIKPPKSAASNRTVIVLPEYVHALQHVPVGFTHHSNFYNRVWKPALRQTGLNWRFHDLRHYYATTLIRRGIPIHLVSQMMGHSKTSVTLDIYAGFMQNDLDFIRGRLLR